MSLPNFIIAGERRSGTTSLAKWIEAHPQIFLHPKMDMAYFVDDRLKQRAEPVDYVDDDQRWWNEHSSEGYAAEFVDGEGKIAVGEKSADYVFFESAHARLKAIVPNAKIIITIRDPIERAWSMYWNEVGKGRETLSFEQAVESEQQRIAESPYKRLHFSYISRGFYAASLRKFFQTIPQEQVRVVVLEESLLDPEATLRSVYSFLNVDPELGLERAHNHYNNNWTTLPTDFWKKNRILAMTEKLVSKTVRTGVRIATKDTYQRRRWQTKIEGLFRKTKEDLVMPVETRARLVELYRPHMADLADVLGRPIEVWNSLKN